MARGGSSRLPRKNVADLCNIPVVAWTIIQALDSLLVDEVYVGTDDFFIADIAREYGAHVVRRPVELNNVNGGVAMAYIAEQIERYKNDKLDVILSLMPTYPIRPPGEIDKRIRHYLQRGKQLPYLARETAQMVYRRYDSGIVPISCNLSGYYYINDRSIGISNREAVIVESKQHFAEHPELMDDSAGHTRAQFAIDNGEGTTITDFYEVEPWQCMVDIDHDYDLELAKAIMTHYILQNRHWKEVYTNYEKRKPDTIQII